MKTIFSILIFSVLFFSCNKIDTTQDTIDDHLISEFLSSKKINAIKTNSGLYYILDSIGQGKKVNPTNTIYVKYTGKLINDSIFDQSLNGTYL